MTMPMTHPVLCQPRQRGVALAVALILLVIITLLGLSAVRLSSMELRMSGNDELRVSSFEAAASLVDAAIANATNTPAISAGVRTCAKLGALVPACTTASVSVPTYTTDVANDLMNVEITGITGSTSPPTGSGWSSKDYAAANLKIAGIYDRNADGRGRATISEGLAVIYSRQGQTGFGGGPVMQSAVP
jgi:Tfp pilus assembly protein PilX